MTEVAAQSGMVLERLQDWFRFVKAESHILTEYPELVWQQGANQPKQSAVSQHAEAVRSAGRWAPRPWLRWVNRPDQRSSSFTTLSGHDFVCGVAVTPSGDRIVSAGFDKMLHVWDGESGERILTLRGHKDSVLSVAVTPDGRRIVSGSENGVVRTWDTETGQRKSAWRAHRSGVSALAVFPDCRRVVSAGSDGKLRIWEIESGRKLAVFQGHSELVSAVAVMPCGERVVSGGHDELIYVWSAETGEELYAWSQSHWVNCLAMTADGESIVSSAERAIKVWDASCGELRKTLSVPRDSVRALTVSPDGRLIVTGGYDSTVRVWELSSGRQLRCMYGHGALVNAVCVTPDGTRILSGSADGTVKVWEIEESDSVPGDDGREARPAGIRARMARAFRPDERQLLPDDRWHELGVAGLAFIPGTERLVSADAWNIKTWSLPGADDGPLLHRAWRTYEGPEFGGKRHLVQCIAVTPSGKRIISGGRVDHTLKIWSARSGRCLRTLRGHGGAVKSVAVAPDGRRFVSTAEDGTVRIWSAMLGRCRKTLEGHEDLAVVTAVASPDGRRVASGGWDRTLRVWDAQSGRPLLVLQERAPVVALCFAPDGRRIISGNDDGDIKVWDAETGLVVYSRKGHRSSVTALAVSSDGEHVVSVSQDKTLKVWDGETFRCLSHFFSPADLVAVDVRGGLIIAGDERGHVYCLEIREHAGLN